MLTCPMCKKSLADATRHCPRCSTDLTLLVDYVKHQEEGLARAERLTRAGQLGDAVWAYLEVLEVDPENAAARKQVGQVVTAVRQFDRAAPGRRWLEKLRKREQFRRWLEGWSAKRQVKIALVTLIGAALLASAFVAGYYLGKRAAQPAELWEETAKLEKMS